MALEEVSAAIRAREMFEYFPDTGLLLWRNPCGGPVTNGCVAGTLIKGRRRVGWLGKYWPATHIIWLIVYGKLPKFFVDHKDNDPSNDRLTNLQDVSKSEDSWKKEIQANNSSGYRGVHRCKLTGKWVVQIRKTGVAFVNKRFNTLEEAVSFKVSICP